MSLWWKCKRQSNWTKGDYILYHFNNWLNSLVDIIDSLITFLTLGIVYLGLDFKTRSFQIKRQYSRIEKRKRDKK